MSPYSLLLAGAFFLGCICGLRSMIGPALLCWAAATGWLRLNHSPLSFLAYRTVLIPASFLAICEMALDKTPGIPSRVDTGPLFVRFVSGAFCGVALALSAHQRVFFPLLLGGFGALAGAGAGYWGRRFASRLLHISNVPAGLLEDLFAVFAGVWFLWYR